MENDSKREIADLKKHVDWLDRELRKTVSRIFDLEDKLIEEKDPWKRVGLNADYVSGYSFYVKY